MGLDLAKVDPEDYKRRFSKPLPEGFVFKMLTLDDMHYFEKLNLRHNYLQVMYDCLSQPESHQCFAIIDTKKDALAYYCWTNWLKSITTTSLKVFMCTEEILYFSKMILQ